MLVYYSSTKEGEAVGEQYPNIPFTNILLFLVCY